MGIIFLLIVALAVSGWITYRTDKAYEIRTYVLDLIRQKMRNDWSNGKYGIDYIVKYYKKMPSYSAMVFSFKRLRLETYFTEQEIKEMKG